MENPLPSTPEVKEQDASIPAIDAQKVGDATEQGKFDMDQVLREATAGSEKAQLDLGIHFLKLAESEIDKEENSDKALQWLLASSRQGNVEATQRIRQCVQTNFGITDCNKEDVMWCLNTSASEKKIRHAAKSMFKQLHSGDGAMSKEQYVEAINKLTAGHEKERKLLLAAGKKIGSTITENDFVKTLSQKINGTLTISSSELDSETAGYQSAGLAQKIFVYPKQTASILVDRSLEYASKEGMSIIMSIVPTSQIYLLLLMFVYSFITPSLLMLIIPMLVFVISTVALIISTLQMFYRRRKQRDATDLAALLQQQFDTGIDLESTASQYSWNSLTPYLVFFSFLPIMVASFSLTSKSYIPCSELFTLAMVMTGFSFFGLSDSHDTLTMLTLGSHLFAILPIYLAKLPHIPVISYLLALVTQPFVTLELGLGFSFNLGLPTLVYMLIPFLFFRMAMRSSWSGFHKVLIPHLVCYFWFCVSTTVFPYTTWKGLFRASLGYALMPILIPVVAFAAVGGVFFLAYKLLQTQMIGKLVITAVLLAVPLLISQAKFIFGKKKGGEKPPSPRMEKIKKVVMIVFSAVALIPLLFVQVPLSPTTHALQISWEDFKELCIPASDKMIAPYQVRCHDFLGFKGSWKGTVQQVTITKRENTAESVINSLPSFLSTTLFCIYGDPIQECNEQTMISADFKHCELMKSTGHTCHLRQMSQLSFSVSVLVDGVTITLNAGSGFKGQMMALMQGDVIEFVGSIESAGTSSPQMKLKSMNCTSRPLPVMMDLTENTEDYMRRTFSEALELTVNFALFPIISFSPEEMLSD